MKKLIFIISLVTIVPWLVIAEDLYYLDEGFEDPVSRSYWSVDPIDPSETWKYTYGGQWKSGGNPYNPEIPKQGSLNAGLYAPDLVLDTMKLITPMLQLAGSGKPTLRFFHCQYELLLNGVDNLRLLFRNGPNDEWDLIDEWVSDIAYWKNEIYDIENLGSHYLTDSFQIAFEGIVGNAYGVYIDSITVIEDAVVPKFVKSITYQSVEYDAIPAGGKDIPLEEIVIRILGNSGDATLDSLTVIPSGTALSHVVNDSFKLFITKDETFAPFKSDTSTLISTASLSGGKVVFADIDYDMFLGDNHFWVTTSFQDNVVQTAKLSFSVPANGINVSDTLLPASTVNFDTEHTIFETIFYDDFESGDDNWVLDSNFIVGKPTGNSVSTQKNPDSPFNGFKILATSLDSGYLANIDSLNAYYAYSPELDLTYYINTSLYMQSFFSINGPDDAVMDISIDGGTSWQNIWTSDASSNNSTWSEFYDKTSLAVANRESQFQFRFGIYNSESNPWPGLSIDNFAIITEKLGTDVGITEVLLPYDDCLDCGNDTVRMWVKNYADGASPSEIPVFFGLWGLDSTLVYDTIYGSIAKDDSTLFTFSSLASFPIGDFYDDFIVGIDLNNDQDPLNDTLTKPLVIQQYSTPTHFENFEYKGGIWLESDSSTWQNLNMGGTITTDPESPHVWVLSPFGNYANNDTSFVVSGCYDLSSSERNIVQFKYWSDTEVNKDGARFEYSIDDGITWNMLTDPLHDTAWNWTIDQVDGLGSKGWSGTNEWSTVKALIPTDADSDDKVKFRVMFMSDFSEAHPQGFAFNDLQIYPAPPDAGISVIDIPKDTCQFSYPDTMQVWVKNYGFNDLQIDDTIIIGYDFESEAAEVDTFTFAADVLPGDSAMFTLPTSFDVNTPATYHIKAYTLIEDEPWFYGSNNDTATKDFTTWLNPITDLLDTISSRQPDTLLIEPRFEPEYSYKWGDETTTSTYDVSEPGTYYLTVTESVHGCQTHDSIYIELLFNDVGIDSVIWPQSSCELSSSENVQVQIRNFGTDSLIISDEILLYYQLDGGAVIEESLTLDAALYSGANRWFTFEETSIDVSAPDDYSIKAFTDYGGDTIPENDTVVSNFTVFGYPTLNLGNDTIIEDLSYAIDINPSFASYLWSDGDTVGTRIIDSSGLYTLDIVDINGCPADDDLDIWFKIRDISPVALLDPITECNRSGTDNVMIQLENKGTDTIPVSDDISLSYKINANTRVTEIINIDGLLPGATYNHTFSGTIDLTTIDIYNFNITSITSGDLRTNNDTINSEITTNTNPVVDLDFIDGEVYYVAEMVLNAGSGTNYGYLWQDGSTNQTYTATDRGTISITVTDTVTGCYGSDSKYLYLDILDYMVTTADIDATTCAGDYEDVDITILNNGNLPRQGAEITLDYYMNDAFLFTENFENVGSWIAGDSRIHTTQNTLTLEGAGSADLRIELSASGDLRGGNDNFERTYTLNPSPDVDLGADAQEVVFPHTLNAGSGYSSYLWSNGSTGSTFTATVTGTYTVVVTGSNGCTTTRTVYLTNNLSVSELALKTMDVNVFPNPANDYITVEVAFDEPGKYILEIFNSQNGNIIERQITEQEYQEEFYIGDLPAGLYFIRIRNEDMYHVSKMVIQ